MMHDDEALSDASFVVSADPDSPVPANRPGSLKRDSRSKMLPGKRFADAQCAISPAPQGLAGSPSRLDTTPT